MLGALWSETPLRRAAWARARFVQGLGLLGPGPEQVRAMTSRHFVSNAS